jgi:ABC-2 type transport system ATP-binding protein
MEPKGWMIIARWSFLKRRTRGKSLLLTSHVLTEVDEMADRVALIHRGSIPVVGTPGELKAALGAADFFELEKSALPAATREKILRLETVLLSMEREPQWISFGVTDALAGAEAIIRVLREDNVRAGFRHHMVSLEDAFIHHIGELVEKFDQ